MVGHTYRKLRARLKAGVARTVHHIYFKPAFAAISLSIFILIFAITAELASAYAHYAAVIDSQLNVRSFYQPPGIYSAPRRVSMGQRITREEFIERLLSAGYLEGEETKEFTTGNFVTYEHEVKFCTSKAARTGDLPPCLIVRFEKNQVKAIEDVETGCRLNSLLLPPEMLTDDLNHKRQMRRATSREEIPDVLLQALCAAEDRNFFSHQGVDFAAMVRAAIRNLKHRGIREGGSTITQQLVKNQFLSPERTWNRKFAELMMAIALERRLTKDQILTLYCDRIYLGHIGMTAVYGFKQAAHVFFGKEIRDLTLAEAALMAGLVKAPNHYAPHSRLNEALARRNAVLDSMAERGYITRAEAAIGKDEQPAMLSPQKLDHISAPHFVDYVKREINRQHVREEDWSQLRIETTLDPDLQQAANQALAIHLGRIDKLVKRRAHKTQPEAAIVALDPQTGEILAMVGGRDYTASQLNRVTDAERQPGSVFKPVVYAAALSQGVSPATTYINSLHPIEFGYQAVYRPQNYGRSYSNQPVTLRESVVRSINVVTVDAAMQTGLENVARLAERMGLPRPSNYPSMALGAFEAAPLEIARAYTTFASGGFRVEPLAIRNLRYNGATISSNEPSRASVLSSAQAYLVTDALAEVINHGTASVIRALGYRGPAAGKTGTSRDAWFVGYTPKLLVVVWVGYDDHTDLGLTGGEGAAPIWGAFIKRALELRPDLSAKQFHRPAGLEVVEIDPETGALANEFCPNRRRMLIISSLAPGLCFQHQEPVEVIEAEPFDSEYQVLPDLKTDDQPPPYRLMASPPQK
jgi:penicillin-binding protein 1B